MSATRVPLPAPSDVAPCGIDGCLAPAVQRFDSTSHGALAVCGAHGEQLWRERVAALGAALAAERSAAAPEGARASVAEWRRLADDWHTSPSIATAGLCRALRAACDAIDAARAEGRAEVDAAFETVATLDLDPSPGCSSSTVGLTRDAWTDGTVAWSCDRDTAWTTSPSAAILAAAAALASAAPMGGEAS